MPTKVTLAERRTEIKERMKSYQALPERILGGVGRLFGARGDAFDWDVTGLPAHWFNGSVIAVLLLGSGLGLSAFLGERLTWPEIWLMTWAAATGSLALIANKVNVRIFLETFRGSCLDKIRSLEDLNHLDDWLRANFYIPRPLFSGLLVGPILGSLLEFNWLANNPVDYHLGPFYVLILASIEAAWVAYYFYPFYVSLPARLSHYHYDLYAMDPSSSEVVGRLSHLLTTILYVSLGVIVWLTLGLVGFNVLNVFSTFIFSLTVWAPTVALYLAGQIHLSNLITPAKWKTLNQIQTRVEMLDKKQAIPDRETLQRLKELMDYHDRVKSTPDSALNFRAILNFLSALLLPVLAASVERVVNFIKDLVK
jgi:hypothetical protein